LNRLSNPIWGGAGFWAASSKKSPNRQFAKGLIDKSAKEQQAESLLNQGKFQAAEALYRELIIAGSNNFVVYGNLAAICGMQSRFEELIILVRIALELNPDYPEGHYNLGLARQAKGLLEPAIASYNKALQLRPTYSEAHNNLGNALKEQGNLFGAVASYSRALDINPYNAEAHNNLGNAFMEQGNISGAIAAYSKALELNVCNPEAHYNIGNALREDGDIPAAIAYYNKALELNPLNSEAHNHLGNALMEQANLLGASASYKKALELNPLSVEAHYNLGIALKELGDLPATIASFNKALQINPDFAEARSQKLYQQACICDWEAVEDDRSVLTSLGLDSKSVTPFTLLSLEDSPERHKLRSENYARATFPKLTRSLPLRTLEKPESLRIGYFSADFHCHATMYLLSEIFSLHDKTQFEIFAFSYGRETQDEMRKKLVSAVDVFHDISAMNDAQIIELAREEGLDIAVDLKGFTKESRLSLFAHGLAPVQISYLGYPGTIGAEFIDYIIADAVVIPKDKRHYYSEKIIYLPYSYQPNDSTRVISDVEVTRKDFGLPTDGFVFCCFNSSFKITPIEFDIRMRLLGKIDESVLWLLNSNQWATINLIKQAEARGISADRLIFADKLPHAEHLARHRLADLFLDTFNYNAHTTTSDALWAGLPVVTKLGQSFAARVSASLLTAVGLPELIAESEEAYEALIWELVAHPDELAKIKLRLKANLLTQPLFNTKMYIKHLEYGYLLAHKRCLQGYPADTIIIPA
jgi:predicted O-linked N-acetylglucosamine transferase (SPINDLY family)